VHQLRNTPIQYEEVHYSKIQVRFSLPQKDHRILWRFLWLLNVDLIRDSSFIADYINRKCISVSMKFHTAASEMLINNRWPSKEAFVLFCILCCSMTEWSMTRWITPFSRVLLKRVTQLIKKFIASYGTWRFIIMFTRANHWSLLLILQPSPTSCHFLPLRSKHSPQHLILKLNLCCTLRVKDQVSHP